MAAVVSLLTPFLYQMMQMALTAFEKFCADEYKQLIQEHAVKIDDQAKADALKNATTAQGVDNAISNSLNTL